MAGVVLGKSPGATFWAKKAASVLRLGFGGGSFLRALRQGEHVRVIESNLGRNATILPVLDALDAAAEAGRNLRGAAKLLDEVFVGKHRLLHELV